MSIGVLTGIANVADIDTRLVLAKAGVYVPRRPIQIPDIVLIPWDHHEFWIERRIGRFQMTWYPRYGFTHFKNQRTGMDRRMDVHVTMKVVGMDGKVTYHPDYIEPCKCGCGYNTDRSHRRILPRAVPRSFTK